MLTTEGGIIICSPRIVIGWNGSRYWRLSCRWGCISVPTIPNCQFLFGFGGKLLLPVWNRYKVTDGSLETRGYYPDLNVELYNLPHHGFGVDNTHYKGSVDTRLGASLFIDMGFCQRLSYASSIYFRNVFQLWSDGRGGRQECQAAGMPRATIMGCWLLTRWTMSVHSLWVSKLVCRCIRARSRRIS